MSLFFFDTITTLLYVGGIIYLLREFQRVSPSEKLELQTVPLLLAASVLYVAVMWKIHALTALFAGV